MTWKKNITMKLNIFFFCIVISSNTFCQEESKTAVVQYTDSFISLIQEDNYIQAFNLTDELYASNEMTLDEFVQYFQTIKSFYGQIIDFQIELRSINILDKTDKIIRAFGEIEFENAKGYIYWILKKQDDDMLKLDYFSLTIQQYTEIESLNKLSKNAIEFIKIRDFDALYNSTRMYKQFTPKEIFNKDVEKIIKDELDEYKLKNTEIRVRKSRTYINLNYEINNQGDVLMFEYVENDESTYLDNLHFFFNDKNRENNSESFKTSKYKNKKFNFSCKYPSNWEIKHIKGYTVIFNEPKLEDDLINTTFDIQTFKSTNINEFCENYEKSLIDSETFKELKIISKTEIDFKGFPAIEYQCSARILDLILVKWKSIVFLNDKSIFKLTTTSMIGKDFLNKNKTEIIFETFRFK